MKEEPENEQMPWWGGPIIILFVAFIGWCGWAMYQDIKWEETHERACGWEYSPTTWVCTVYPQENR